MTRELYRFLLSPHPPRVDDALLDAARAAKVLPNLREAAARHRIDLPPAARPLLTQAFVNSTRIAQGGLEALAVLQKAAVPAAAFKGLAAAALIYDGPRHRTLQDTDLLVAESDLERAVDALAAFGFRPDFPGSLADYRRFAANAPGFSGNLALSLVSRHNVEVDLHWRIGPRHAPAFHPPSLLARAVPAPLLNGEIAVLPLPELALLTVHHTLRNHFRPDMILRDLLDLRGWLTLTPLPTLLDAARASGLFPPTVAMLRILAAFDAIEPANLPADPRAADIEDLFFHQLDAGPLNRDLLLLVSPRSWSQLLAGAASWSSFRAHMRSFETRGGKDALSLSGRLRHLTRAAASLGPAGWRRLRTLHRAKAV